ncbi:hypothetical protein [Vibrio crassostreae]|uniref:hypothetical protein n=1 Tax=Vibrio crassostreae TaxID=246167 RepID=UPI001B3044A6|nr:hypothetical protein [Vibrio crassostreae]
MLTESGLKYYLCPSCNSGEVFNSGKGGLFNIGGKAILRLHKNKMLCCNCGEMRDWSGRLKLSSKDVKRNPSLLEIKKPMLSREFYSTTSEVSPYELVLMEHMKGEATPDGVIWMPEYKDDFSHWTHGADWFEIWAPYNGWRFKDYYSIQLWDGLVLHEMYPNGGSWSGKGELIPDESVRFVRLSKSTWLHRGEDEKGMQWRAERNVETFGVDESSWSALDKNAWDELLKEVNDEAK